MTSLSATKPPTTSARAVAPPSRAPFVPAEAPGLVAALGATLPAAPIGAAALGSEAAEAPTEGEGEALSRARCAKAADANTVATIAVITSTRSNRLKASFPFSFSEARRPPS